MINTLDNLTPFLYNSRATTVNCYHLVVLAYVRVMITVVVNNAQLSIINVQKRHFERNGQNVYRDCHLIRIFI